MRRPPPQEHRHQRDGGDPPLILGTGIRGFERRGKQRSVGMGRPSSYRVTVAKDRQRAMEGLDGLRPRRSRKRVGKLR